jgi:hypothetical protein
MLTQQAREPGITRDPLLTPKEAICSRRRARKPSLAAALKEAVRAGMSVRSAIVEPERIMLQFGDEAPAPTNELDEWLKKHAHANQGH